MPAIKYWDGQKWVLVPTGGLDQSVADGLYVNAAGDTMTGPLVLPSDPVTALQAAPKQYIDNRTPPIIVLNPNDPVPPATAPGTVIVRLEA